MTETSAQRDENRFTEDDRYAMLEFTNKLAREDVYRARTPQLVGSWLNTDLEADAVIRLAIRQLGLTGNDLRGSEMRWCRENIPSAYVTAVSQALGS